jgi:EAL domain-containing protein (putative c-di-GMP-specific phosphodiesterase class I)
MRSHFSIDDFGKGYSKTDEQLAFLENNECDEIQGYHFSKPLEPEAVAALLLNQSSATLAKNNAPMVDTP